MRYFGMIRTCLVPLFLLISSASLAAPDVRLAKAFRENRGGWVYVHLEGAPRDIGFQHGYLLAPEIDDAVRMFRVFLKKSSGHDWTFYRNAAKTILWPKVDPEYREEIAGIAEGLRARGMKYDTVDMAALNGWIELAWYYVPMFDEKMKKAKGKGAGEHCSAFIATGKYTRDGKIVMAHNAWVDYVVGERWNVIADIVPKRGSHILMDCMPGFIHSGDDFVINGAGIIYTETTIGGFKGFSEKGIPEFQRARKAAQYSRSINDFVRIMRTGNNGGYANDWLVGDIRTNEIARLELGLKNSRVWRTKDGILYGCNYPADEKLAAEETSYDPADTEASNNARKLRWEETGESHKGKIDAEVAKRFMMDHQDAAAMCKAVNLHTLCGHGETDPKGMPEAGWGPYYPTGAAQGKVTTSALAKNLRLWARMGHPCGKDFLVKPFLKAHKEYRWQAGILRDMKAGPWELFSASSSPPGATASGAGSH